MKLCEVIGDGVAHQNVGVERRHLHIDSEKHAGGRCIRPASSLDDGAALALAFRGTGQVAQFAKVNPGTRSNSRVLLVTRITPSA